MITARFTIRGLLVFTAFAAVSVASLVWANETLMWLWRLATSGALAVALLAAILDRGRRRYFAVAILLVGASYNVTAHLGPVVMLKLFDQPAHAFGTSPLLDAVYDLIKRDMYSVHNSDQWSSSMPAGPNVMLRSFPNFHAFKSVAFDILTLILGYASGVFAASIYERRSRGGAGEAC
ncbi:MAG: hypothetical protein H0T51_22435 [Pirellulales bacterium]|nr:hypothetical protein [Pirellulales bacterium]